MFMYTCVCMPKRVRAVFFKRMDIFSLDDEVHLIAYQFCAKYTKY